MKPKYGQWRIYVRRNNDGTSVTLDTSTKTWAKVTTEKFCYYNNTTNADSIKKYGALYNWYTVDTKKYILAKLNQAVTFEQFLQTKYVGQKRFSLEGGETLIPALGGLVRTAAEKYDVDEFVLGMAHRGRLNTLVNIFRKVANGDSQKLGRERGVAAEGRASATGRAGDRRTCDSCG